MATSTDLAFVVRAWVSEALVDDVLVWTYARAWRVAARRPATLAVRTWLTAMALAYAASLSGAHQRR